MHGITGDLLRVLIALSRESEHVTVEIIDRGKQQVALLTELTEADVAVMAQPSSKNAIDLVIARLLHRLFADTARLAAHCFTVID